METRPKSRILEELKIRQLILLGQGDMKISRELLQEKVFHCDRVVIFIY